MILWEDDSKRFDLSNFARVFFGVVGAKRLLHKKFSKGLELKGLCVNFKKEFF